MEQDFAARKAAIHAAPALSSAGQQLTGLDNEQAGERLRHSYAGRLGRLIEPAIAPLGFDWKMGIGIVASFAAREVFVSTMAVVYNLGDYDKSEAATARLATLMRQETRTDGTPVYSPL